MTIRSFAAMLAAALLSALSGTAPATAEVGGTPYVTTGYQYGFLAYFPGMPQQMIQHIQDFDVLIFMFVDDVSEIVYGTTVRDIGVGPADVTDPCAQDTNLPPGRTLRSASRITVSGNPGCDVVADDSVSHIVTHSHNFIYAKRLYRAMVAAPAGHEHDAEPIDFLNTFQSYDPGAALAPIPTSGVTSAGHADNGHLVSAVYGFSVDFPTPPTRRQEPDGTVRFSITDGDDHTFSVVVSATEEAVPQSSAEQRMKTIDDTLADFVQAVRGTPRRPTTVTIDSVGGREQIVDTAQQTWLTRILVTDRFTYQLVFSGKKSEESGAAARTFLGSFHLQPVTAVPAQTAQAIKPFVSPAHGFAAAFPAPPVQHDNTEGSTTFDFEDVDGLYYCVVILPNSKDMRHLSASQKATVLDNSLELAAVGGNGTLRSKKTITVDGVAGREGLLDTPPNHAGVTRILMTDDHMFQVIVAGDKGDETGPKATAFMSSFHLLPGAAAHK